MILKVDFDYPKNVLMQKVDMFEYPEDSEFIGDESLFTCRIDCKVLQLIHGGGECGGSGKEPNK